MPAAPPRSRAAALLASATTLLALAGCGAGAGDPVTGVSLTVSADFGSADVRTVARPEVAGEDTVMRLLQRNTKAVARDGGQFVTGIDALQAGIRNGTRYDWVYYVDGVSADRGAASWKLRSGERVWWDLHPSEAWPGGTPAVVGSFPKPLAGGFDGGRNATATVRCAAPSKAACRLVTERLTEAGAKLVSAPASGEPRKDGDDAPIQVIVARLDQLEDFGDEARSLLQGPADSGVFMRRRGRIGLQTLDPTGKVVATAERSTGVVAALRHSTDAPVWAVTGTDDQGVRRAAKALDERSLANRAAVVVDADGVRGLPEPATSAG